MPCTVHRGNPIQTAHQSYVSIRPLRYRLSHSVICISAFVAWYCFYALVFYQNKIVCQIGDFSVASKTNTFQAETVLCTALY